MKPSTRTPLVRGHAARELDAPRTSAPAVRRTVAGATGAAGRKHAASRATGKGKAPRTRRSASEARKRILEAAQRELLRVGPEALRLTDLARQLQVSHPAILHHFGSREGLVAAVVRHSLDALTQQLMATLDTASTKRIDRVELVDMVASVCREGGLARLLAFLLLENREPADKGERAREPIAGPVSLEQLVAATHDLRQRLHHPASFEDTRFEIQLIAIVLLGDAIFGDAVRRATGMREDEAPSEFRRRLTQLLPR